MVRTVVIAKAILIAFPNSHLKTFFRQRTEKSAGDEAKNTRDVFVRKEVCVQWNRGYICKRGCRFSRSVAKQMIKATRDFWFLVLRAVRKRRLTCDVLARMSKMSLSFDSVHSQKKLRNENEWNALRWMSPRKRNESDFGSGKGVRSVDNPTEQINASWRSKYVSTLKKVETYFEIQLRVRE